ncbi:Hint domain-containing protein [Pseudorhodobacter ferrugineus]|uniref:Hint domain-containing protein n=1 Tax=Pseudorhodobacter ferrugineus TaxID=77008 RepID=UPI0003FDF290|nr:Hint domain-containing protein [Pseudorhodobacter ferrugineus]
MQATVEQSALPRQICQVFTSDDVFVSIGVNLNEGLAGLDDACLGDIYELAQGVEAQKLVLQRGGDAQTVAEGSALGTPGALVTIAARYTMMAPDGDKVEMLALRVWANAGLDGAYYILPLSPMGPQIEYTLVKMEEPQPEERLMDLLCISFARGTMITLDDGTQRPIEDLAAGDRVLTRDHGPQDLRWVGHVTLRAVGAYAPVMITAGVMGNAGDLVVSQHHRMFLYQRRKANGVPKSEILVQAKHLVNGNTVFLREGGFVDYYSLVFDAHEIIYAEGIPAESLMVTEATVSRLPPDLAAEVKKRFPGLSQSQHFGTEASAQVLGALGLDRQKRSEGGR